MKTLIKLFIITIVLQSGMVLAQNDSVVVIAPYQPSISDAVKINFSPKISSQKVERQPMEYSIISRKIATEVELEQIKLAKFRERKSHEKLQRNQIRLGAGNYSTTYMEFFANSIQNEDFALGVHAKHLASNGKIDGYGNPANSENLIELSGTKFWKEYLLKGDIHFDREVVHFYGFEPALFPNNDTAKNDELYRQRFVLLEAKASGKSMHNSKNKLNHSFNTGFYHLYDKFESAENHFNFDANLNHNVNWLKVLKNQNFGVDLGFKYYNSGDSTTAYNAMFFDAAPYLATSFTHYDVKLGFKTSVASDQIQGDTATNTKVYFYPVVDLKIHIVPEHLSLFGGLSGKQYRNGYRSLTEENPYINPVTPVSNTNYKFEAYGGISASIGQSFDMNLGVYNSTVDDMIFFEKDIAADPKNMFTYVKDNGQILRIHADMALELKEAFKMKISANYYDYKLESLEHAWYKPQYDGQIDLSYKFLNQFEAHAGMYMCGKRWAREYTEPSEDLKAIELDGIIDANIGLDYDHNENLGAFIRVNNILASRYYNWVDYPSYKLNAIAGVKYSF
ncbi:MAG: hypothetical protein JEZ03_11905 [Bacteroidales bacterium]|nr:hypothetical protein [Bacteroidales bacterium]